MKTTDDRNAMTCEVCARRMARLDRVEIYAGESIRSQEISYWDTLNRQYRYRYARRNPSTAGLHGFAWYQFSREQRRLLLAEMLKSGETAWALGLPALVEADRVSAAGRRRMLKTARDIVSRVRKGEQNVGDLARVVEILNRLAREVAR
ncbi:hypothetical protein [Saccharospirillum salsuginis]|nr:hypothetical protein [Saccharospirillum salsuginis]